MTAFFVSCGEGKKTDENQAPTGYINPLLSENLTDGEVKLITRTCNQLKSKAREFRQNRANTNRNYFFNGKKEFCGSTGFNFQYQASIIDNSRVLSYRRVADGRTFYGFKDILTNDSPDIEEFCEDAFSGRLDGRTFLSGRNLVQIDIKALGNDTVLTLSNAILKSNDNYFITKQNEYVISASNGFTLRRVFSDFRKCRSAEKTLVVFPQI